MLKLFLEFWDARLHIDNHNDPEAKFDTFPYPWATHSRIHKINLNCNHFISSEYIILFRFSCDRETTFCLMAEPEPADSASHLISSLASRAKYICVCKEGFYVPNQTVQGFQSDTVEKEPGNFSCTMCPVGCPSCDSEGLCVFGSKEPEDILTESVLRATIGAILGACVCCCVGIAIIVFRQRKCKVGRSKRLNFRGIFSFFIFHLLRRLLLECGQFWKPSWLESSSSTQR